MALPDSRDMTAALGDPVPSATFNNMQDYLVHAYGAAVHAAGYRARLEDITGALSTARAFTLGLGAYVYPTATALQVGNRAGVLAQVVSGRLLTLKLAQDAILHTLGAADPTNPRVDVIQVQLTGSGINSSVKVGTPAATPTEVAVDAGFVKWAAVKVPALYASAFVATTHLRQWAIPAGNVQSGLILPSQLVQDSVAPFSTGLVDLLRYQAGAAAQKCYAVIPAQQKTGMLMRLDIRAKISGGGAMLLRRVSLTGTTGSYTTIKSFGDTAGAEAAQSWVTSCGAPGSDTALGPVWMKGYEGGPEAQGGVNDDYLILEFTSGANTDYVAQVRWEVAAA